MTKEEAQRIIDSFLRECLQCWKLGHPNIVQFFGVYPIDSSVDPDDPSGDAVSMQVPVMVMEKMACSLTSFMNTHHSIALDTKFSIITDVACGLHYLHSQNPPILHRDLTPNNILLTNYNVAKIADFGVSKVIQAGDRNTKVPGNPDFMPPEAFDEDDVDYDCSFDVFSFAGVILYTFTEKWPRPSKANKHDAETGKLIAFSEVQRRAKYLDLMTGESIVLKQLIEKCLDEVPTVRPSMADIHEEIKGKRTTLSQDGVQQPKNKVS